VLHLLQLLQALLRREPELLQVLPQELLLREWVQQQVPARIQVQVQQVELHIQEQVLRVELHILVLRVLLPVLQLRDTRVLQRVLPLQPVQAQRQVLLQ
jgi:hypothetical protein